MPESIFEPVKKPVSETAPERGVVDRKPIPWEQVMKDLGITEEDIETAEDDEIE